jgi:hypothetical protein
LDYFTFVKCAGFVMYLPGEKEFGIYTDGQGQVVQRLADYTEAYINDRMDKVFFKRLIEDWLEFDITKTTKFDDAMGAAFTLVAVKSKAYKRSIEASRDVNEYFKMYQAS